MSDILRINIINKYDQKIYKFGMYIGYIFSGWLMMSKINQVIVAIFKRMCQMNA